MANPPEQKLLQRHAKLVHSNNKKVVSHVQREQDEWILNTLMIEGVDVPFKYLRKKQYKSLNNVRVNLTYYPDVEVIAGFEIEFMKVVRIKVA